MSNQNKTLKILGVSGSLRNASMNKGLLRAAQEVAPEGSRIEIYDIADLPMYNQDVESYGLPEPVVRFREAIREADALLIATPEYNGSIPGVLKNALEWASRPPTDSVLKGKPAGILGASASVSGTLRAQLALRQIFLSTETHAMLKPEFILASALPLFDANGDLQDAATKDRLAAYVGALTRWVARLEQDEETLATNQPVLVGVSQR